MGGRFVDEEEGGAGGRGSCEHETLRFSPGEAVEALMGERVQSESSQQVECFCFGFAAAGARSQQGEGDVIEDAPTGRPVGVLKHPCGPPLPLARDRPFGGGRPSGDETEQRALAASRGADEGVDLPGDEARAQSPEQPGASGETVSDGIDDYLHDAAFRGGAGREAGAGAPSGNRMWVCPSSEERIFTGLGRPLSRTQASAPSTS